MLDKSKRYLVVGLGLLGGKYALELSKAGFHVDGINRSEGHLQYALDHGYIASGKTHDFEDAGDVPGRGGVHRQPSDGGP